MQISNRSALVHFITLMSCKVMPWRDNLGGLGFNVSQMMTPKHKSTRRRTINAASKQQQLRNHRRCSDLLALWMSPVSWYTNARCDECGSCTTTCLSAPHFPISTTEAFEQCFQNSNPTNSKRSKAIYIKRFTYCNVQFRSDRPILFTTT